MIELLSGLNWLAIVIAALAGTVVGFVWYLPPLMGVRWAQAVRSYGAPYVADPTIDPMRPANPAIQVGTWLVAFAVNAWVLAALARGLNVTSATGALSLAFVCWLGFAETLSAWPAIFARWPWRLWLINNAAFLIIQAVMSLIVTLWR